MRAHSRADRSRILPRRVSCFFEESDSTRRSQSQQLKDLLRSRADDSLSAVRSDRSLAEVVEAQRTREAGTSRWTAPRVVERKSTNEIIEEETGKIKIEVIAENLQDSVDENGEPRLVESLVEDFKKTSGSELAGVDERTS